MSKMFGKLGNARNIMKVAKLGMKLAEGDFEGAAESGLEGDDGDDDEEEPDEEQEDEEVETVEDGSGEAGVDDSLTQPTQQSQQTTYYEQAVVQQPVSDQTAYVQPAYEQQAYEQSLYGQPVGEQPLYAQPVYEQTVYEQTMPLTQQPGFEHGVGISQDQSALSRGQEGYPPGILQQNFQQQPKILEQQIVYEQPTTSPPLHCDQSIMYEQTDACLQSSYQQPTVPMSSPEAYSQTCLPEGERPVLQPQEILSPASIPAQPVLMEQQLPYPEGFTTALFVEPAIITSGDMSQQTTTPMNFEGPLPPEPMGATCGPSEEPAPDQFQVYANPGSDMKAMPSVSVISHPDQLASTVSIHDSPSVSPGLEADINLQETYSDPFNQSSLQPLTPEPVSMNEARLPVGAHPISVTPTWIGL